MPGFTVDKEAVADFGFYLGAEAGHTLPLIERQGAANPQLAQLIA
jgi:hypothetical protein